MSEYLATAVGLDVQFWIDIGERVLFAWLLSGPMCFMADLAMPKPGMFFEAMGFKWKE